jgi:hypothetical protein
LLPATEGDTKVGAGQSQDRGLPQGVVDHDTILVFSTRNVIPPIDPRSTFFIRRDTGAPDAISG